MTPVSAARFAARLALRNWGRMLFFSASLAAGVAFLFSVGNLLGAFQASIAGRARELLASDFSVKSNRPFSDKTRKVFKKLRAQGVRTTELIQFSSMLRKDEDGSQPFLVSVKAVEREYPLYGKFVTEPPSAVADMFADQGCLIEDAIALQYGLAKGDRVRLGVATLVVTGIITAEPDRSVTAFTLSPRVVLPRALVAKTGLIRFGSRVRHRMLFGLAGTEDPRRAAIAAAGRMEAELDDPYLSVTSFAESKPALRRGLERTSVFFVLVGLIALMLGTLGMASGVTTFLNEQIETVGVLRALGASPGDIRRIYSGLCLLIGLGGGALGVIGGWALTVAGLTFLSDFLGLAHEVQATLHWPSLIEAFALSCTLALGVHARHVEALAQLSAGAVLRDRGESLPTSRRADLALIVGIALLLFGYAFTKADSWRIAMSFTGALAVACAVTMGLIAAALFGLERFLRLLSAPAWFTVRHGILQLVRQKRRTLVFLFSLTLGFTLLGALEAVRHSLADELRVSQGLDIPDLFLIDIQKRQVEPVRSIMEKYARTEGKFSPLVRARLTHIAGTPVKKRKSAELTREGRRGQRFLTREQNLTYKDTLRESEKVVEGRFWEPGETTAQISMESWFAEITGISMGDRLRFDIQGRPLEAVVTSFREVTWSSARPNFFMVFPTKTLEDAPHYFVASLGIRDAEKSALFQREVVSAFPNVSVIDISKILDQVQVIMDALLNALAALAWFCVLTGLLVLAGTVSVAHRERRDQAALLRALGFERAGLIAVDAVEFAVIGVLSFLIAGAVATGLGWFLARELDVAFAPDWGILFKVLAAAVPLPVIVGLASNARIYGAGVLDNLRRDV